VFGGPQRGVGEGLGSFGGICELQADAGRGGEVLVLLTVSPLTAQVSPELRAESGERFECARGGLVEGLDRCGGVIAVVAVAGRGGEDCFLFIVFPADCSGVAGAARRERFQRAPSTWWSWRGSGPLYGHLRARGGCWTRGRGAFSPFCRLFHSFENEMSDAIGAASCFLVNNNNNNNNINNNSNKYQSGASRTREQKPKHDSIIIDHPLFLLSSGLRCRLRHSQRPLAFLLVLRRLDCSRYLILLHRGHINEAAQARMFIKDIDNTRNRHNASNAAAAAATATNTTTTTTTTTTTIYY
jgi:hypothetical protein